MFIEFIASSVMDLAISAVLLCLFMAKLKALSSSILGVQHIRVNHMMAKITLLTAWSLLSTQLLIVLFAATFFMHHDAAQTAQSAFGELSLAWVLFWGLDCCINSLCIFWSFDCTLAWYVRCCRPCHNCCVRMCVRGLMGELKNCNKPGELTQPLVMEMDESADRNATLPGVSRGSVNHTKQTLPTLTSTPHTHKTMHTLLQPVSLL